jgi:hypothetical protein
VITPASVEYTSRDRGVKVKNHLTGSAGGARSVPT